MENNNYIIIDEPRVNPLSNLVLNPLVILFASILIPILWSPPYFGRLWMPLVWLLFNGYALGSATWAKEWIICIVGALCMFLILMSMGFVGEYKIALPYLHIGLNATLFLSLYFAVFTQSTSYELFEYMREKE